MSEKFPSWPPAPGGANEVSAEVSIFDDTEELATTVDAGLVNQPVVPDYPAVATFGRFEILGRLARGGMAEIFLARESFGGMTRHVVVKRILPHMASNEEFIAMFLDEGRIATRLYHPNICHVFECGHVDGSYFMILEWVYGVPLRRVIRRAGEMGGGVPTAIAAKIISQVALALDYAHAVAGPDGEPLGVIHRDVSPHNVMVGWDGSVKLLDFGIAKAATQAERTAAGVLKGKYSYLSPEQCRGGDIDRRSDIFALGILSFETLTGRPLYHRGTVLNTMTAIVQEDVPSARSVLPEITPELDRITAKALQKDPQLRHQRAGEMHLEIEQHLTRTQPVTADDIANFIRPLFDEEERSPLPVRVRGHTGSLQLTPTGGSDSIESGSFGPFGQQLGPRPLGVPDFAAPMPEVRIENTEKLAASLARRSQGGLIILLAVLAVALAAAIVAALWYGR